MKTSNFNFYKGNNGVSIAGKAPENYRGKQYKKLAPSYDIWKQYHDSHDHERYTHRYFNEILSKLNPQEVLNELGEDAVLLCYENPFDFCHRRLVAKWFKYNLNLDVNEIIMSNNLECSSIGDKRFSAFYAKINFLDQTQSIEKFYQEAKRFNGISFPFKEAKGKTPTSFVIDNVEYEVSLLSYYYKFLWLLYFKQHNYRLDVVSHYDTFTDKFKGDSVNCQADVLTQLKLHGINDIIKEIRPLTDRLKERGLI